MDVLVTRSLPGKALDVLSSKCKVDLWEKDEPIPRQELIKRIKGKQHLELMGVILNLTYMTR
ncbi:MAG: hypothetical protein CVT98_10285 [Bacteroidetes bacterium HGW-Bacteroidetes-15]|nr:MAG: hypothetical protein CVT98_10285 [Bacteroidetes bacterium HGW-Bacteroidetes-15]